MLKTPQPLRFSVKSSTVNLSFVRAFWFITPFSITNIGLPETIFLNFLLFKPKIEKRYSNLRIVLCEKKPVKKVSKEVVNG